ncbi:FAD-dependent monooxygenase [Stenotrophomonas sp. Ste96]|jgi:2-polyprenyl-6-methoxyphenol hydroxylase-like FAD-dependent oxidoreductase|uniref:FAD-dependent monooxygenase n=1 Tax=Stenotrophomonas sp. Ste96 TaxID=2926029 RepID=UPI0021C6DEB3|nr:FAD-dependent monooxygenase [Stenotrophomonas sp. Ste96]
MQNEQSEILIVGGSLAGLTFALACARRGMPVRIIERSLGHLRGGDSLTVDLNILKAVVGFDPRSAPALQVVPAYRDLTTWSALYGWLRDRAADTPGIIIEQGRSVALVADDHEQPTVTLDDGNIRTGRAVIGADGYRSMIRRVISPEAPFAQYAGYLVWRGLVDERLLSRPVAWPSDGGLWIDFIGGYRLVAATLPGQDGSLEPGKRQITFAWFDSHQEALLRDTGCLTEDGSIVGTLARGMIDPAVREALLAKVHSVWPPTWAEAVKKGITVNNVLSGAPIAEYRPERLARGRLAVIGDAAHVVSPMTGRGYLTGVEDAEILGQSLADTQHFRDVPAALANYESARLPYVRGLVAHSIRISGDFRQYAARA